ncbi:MAG: hypothetical protein CVU64_20985 [Deltaproteobacteria bacterium HGW-Deltaproteobacteria-21]|nr:MAG: hypothetical protein CVU64_20985 [Deltaproteobacteria bacterium HGW-Deltaproteobacteria-21]
MNVEIVKGSENFIGKWFPGRGFEGSIASARIEAVKPFRSKETKGAPRVIRTRANRSKRMFMAFTRASAAARSLRNLPACAEKEIFALARVYRHL